MSCFFFCDSETYSDTDSQTNDLNESVLLVNQKHTAQTAESDQLCPGSF